MTDAPEYRYNRLTWPEMNDAIGRQPVVILPTGSTEQGSQASLRYRRWSPPHARGWRSAR